MPTDDVRISDWSLLASAGVTASLQFTATTALTSLTVYTGGTVTDVDDLTGATAYVGVLSGGNLIATVALVVPTDNSTPLRLAVNGVVQSVGRLHPSTVGTPVPDNTISLVAGTNSFALTILGVVQAAGGGGVTDGDKGDITVSGSGTVWTIDNGAVTAAKVAADVATQAELDAKVSDAVYGVGWNGDTTTAPSKNAVYDKIETIGGGVTDGDKGDITVTASGATWTIDAGAVTAAKVAADVATQAELDAEAVLARNADNLTSGTVADARIASTIARDSEVAAAFQPLDSDLTAIAALATTATGRSLLAAADAAAIRAIDSSVGLTGNETVAGVKTFSSEPVAPTFKATGNTGALTTPITLTGANATGAPTTGAHVKGEVAGDDTGKLWYCTVAGTPGTWVQIGGGGGVADGDKGDITVTGSGATWTIDPNTVTLAKLADIATARILGRVTAASGDPEELTAAQTRSLVAVLGDWAALGNLGATETITGVDDQIVRSAGTLDQACTITVTTTADQVVELMLTQDATGGRAVTWSISGVVWLTQLGTAPDTSTAPAGSVHYVKVTNVAGTPYAEWRTEPPVEAFTYAIGDETTAITTGAGKITFRAPFACSLVGARASLTTASSSGIPTFDVNESGTTLMSTKLTVDASEKTSVTAATAVVISDNLIADDAEMTIDVDVAGTGAAGAKITLYLRRR